MDNDEAQDRLWVYPPNWREGFRVSSAYRTDIVTSRSGREQRRALRATPRREHEITVTVRHGRLRAFRAVMASWLGRQITMPDWLKSVALIEEVPAGEVYATPDSLPCWLTPGTTVALLSGQQVALRTVAAIEDGRLRFTSGGPLAWLPGTRVYPAITGRLDGRVTERQQTNEVSEIEISFEVDPGSQPEAPDDAWSLYLFDGREVFMHRPNWAQTPRLQHDIPVDRVDFGVGRIQVRPVTDFSTVVRQATFVGRDASEMARLQGFFERMKGQRGEFYMPHDNYALPLAAPSARCTDTLRIAGTEIADDYGDSSTHRAVCVMMTDGRVAFRRVQSVYVVEDVAGRDTTIQVDRPWYWDIDPTCVLRVTWLSVWRFASDRLVVDWLTDQVGQTQMSFQMVETLTTELTAPVLSDDEQWLLEYLGWEYVAYTMAPTLDRVVNDIYWDIGRGKT